MLPSLFVSCLSRARPTTPTAGYSSKNCNDKVSQQTGFNLSFGDDGGGGMGEELAAAPSGDISGAGRGGSFKGLRRQRRRACGQMREERRKESRGEERRGGGGWGGDGRRMDGWAGAGFCSWAALRGRDALLGGSFFEGMQRHQRVASLHIGPCVMMYGIACIIINIIIIIIIITRASQSPIRNPQSPTLNAYSNAVIPLASLGVTRRDGARLALMSHAGWEGRKIEKWIKTRLKMENGRNGKKWEKRRKWRK